MSTMNLSFIDPQREDTLMVIVEFKREKKMLWEAGMENVPNN